MEELVSCMMLIGWLEMIIFSFSNGRAASFLHAIKTCCQWGRGAKNTDRAMSGPEGRGSCFQQQNWLHDALWLDVSSVCGLTMWYKWFQVLVDKGHSYLPSSSTIPPQGLSFNPLLLTVASVHVAYELNNWQSPLAIKVVQEIHKPWTVDMHQMKVYKLRWFYIHDSSLIQVHIHQVTGGYCFQKVNETSVCSKYMMNETTTNTS